MKNAFSLTPGMILRRGHYLYFFYYWLYRLFWDRRIGASMERTLFYDAEGAYPVQCISYPYIRAFLQAVTFAPTDVFVDVGCGWGRLLGYMRRKTPVRTFVGVELNPEAAAAAQNTFRDDPDITILDGSILDIFPPDGTVYYLFNPFDENILSAFLDKAESTLRHKIRLLYLHPTCRQAIDRRPNRWRLVRQIPIKPRHLGELTLCEYENIWEEP